MIMAAEKSADLRIGPIEARIEAADVEAYARATCLGATERASGTVPATFPAIWLWHPEAAAAIAEATHDGTRAPVLIAQRFAYHRPMAIGDRYRFAIERYTDPLDPALVMIEARVHCLDGTLAATVSASYRLFERVDTP
jgi:hypothetical protein